ncbi:MAG: hypothetical protein ABSG55_03330 [Dehalococcoidia bacterium]
MKRLLLALTFVGLLASACAFGNADTPEPTPTTDPRVMELARANDAVGTMLTGRTEGSDYWIRIDYVDRWRTSVKGSNPVAMVVIYLDPPVSYSGDVPTESDPCRGHYDDDGYLLDPNDACTSQTSTVSMTHRDFLKAGVVTVEVDLRRDKVVQVFQGLYAGRAGGGEEPVRNARADGAAGRLDGGTEVVEGELEGAVAAVRR